MTEHSLHSSYREKLIEHLLIGELLKLSWKTKNFSLEISKETLKKTSISGEIHASHELNG